MFYDTFVTGSGKPQPFDITGLMQDLYDCGDNQGFCLNGPPVFLTSVQKGQFMTSEYISGAHIGYRPLLDMTYHYEITLVPGDADGDGNIDGADLALCPQNYDPVGSSAWGRFRSRRRYCCWEPVCWVPSATSVDVWNDTSSLMLLQWVHRPPDSSGRGPSCGEHLHYPKAHSLLHIAYQLMPACSCT